MESNGHSRECQYRSMAEVMKQLEAARDELLDEDDPLVGRVCGQKGNREASQAQAASAQRLAVDTFFNSDIPCYACIY